MTRVGPGQRRELPLRPGRHAWVHVAKGSVSVNGESLGAGDGAAITAEEKLALLGADEAEAEVLAFELA